MFGSSLSCSLFGSGTSRLLSSRLGSRLRLNLGFRLSLSGRFFLCLASRLLCQSRFLGSLATSLLGSSLTSLRLGDTTSILTSGSLSSSFLASQLLGTLLGSGSGGSLTLCLGSGTGTSLCHLLCYQAVDLRIDGSIFLSLVGDDRLDGLLLLLQALHHFLLLSLLTLQGRLFLLSFRQEVVLVSFYVLELLMLVVHLILLRLHRLSLSLLEG